MEEITNLNAMNIEAITVTVLSFIEKEYTIMSMLFIVILKVL